MIYVQNTVLAAVGVGKWSTKELKSTPWFCIHFGSHCRVHMNAQLNELTDPSNSKTVFIVLFTWQLKEKGFAMPAWETENWDHLMFNWLRAVLCKHYVLFSLLQWLERRCLWFKALPTSAQKWRVSHSRWAGATPEAGGKSPTLLPAAGRRPPPPRSRGAAASSLLPGPHS